MPTHLTRQIDGQHTELLIQCFADRTMVIITQLGKVGTMIQATIPLTVELPPKPESPVDNSTILPEPPVAILLTHLVGTARDMDSQTMTDIYASQIATLVWCYMPRVRVPVVVGLAFKKRPDSETNDSTGPESRTRFMETMGLVVEGLIQIEGS